MITFKISKELFQNEVCIQLYCDHLKDCYKTPARIKEDEINVYKIVHIKQALFMMIQRLTNQRRENYNRFGYTSEQHLLAIQELTRCLENYNFVNTSIENLLNLIKTRILPNLQIIAPGPLSHFHTNYAKKITDLENYIDQYQLKINSLKTH